jgi:hypothetical protein
MSRTKTGDWRTYERALINAGLDPDDYADMKEALPYCSTMLRTKVTKSDYELDLFRDELVLRTKEVGNPLQLVYPNDDTIKCSFCEFKELCLNYRTGVDRSTVLTEIPDGFVFTGEANG